MISKLSNNCCDKEEKPFPKLMLSETGGIFIMQSKGTGTLVSKGKSYCDLGEHTSGINTSNMFTDYEGDVCLTNS